MARLATVPVALSLLSTCGDSKNDQDATSSGAPDELLRVVATQTPRLERPGDGAGSGEEMKTSKPGILATGEFTAADREAAKLMPGVAGWDSERLNALVSERLRDLAQPLGEIKFETLLSDDFQPSSLVPADYIESTLPGGIRLLEGKEFTSPARSLGQELEQLRGRIGGEGEPGMRFKTIRVDISDADSDLFSTDVLVDIVGSGSGGTSSQIDVLWQCRWIDKESPRLMSIGVKNYREVHSPGPLFKDATRAVFERAPSFEKQMMHGMSYWAERLTRVDDMSITGHQGIAIGDVNGDGLDDVYVCDGGGLPNLLYIQAVDGTVIDRSAIAQVDFLEDSRSALIVDLDNDGDQDIVVATVALVLFAENDGSGVFTLKGGHPGSPDPFSMAAADFDSDGDLDVYVTSYGRRPDAGSGVRGFEASSPVPYNDANNGGRNILLANHGEFRFSDVTDSVGLDGNNSRWTFAAAWEDYDQDGDTDLYVVNDFGRNNLYRNDGGNFQDIAAELGVEDMAGGMSASWGDSNGDGRSDIYVGNMFSSAGNRVTYQRKFDASRESLDTPAMQRMARGNSLFQQGGTGTFQEVSETAGVTMGRWAWSSGFVDLNNDGWEDLVVANGYLSNRKPDDL